MNEPGEVTRLLSEIRRRQGCGRTTDPSSTRNCAKWRRNVMKRERQGALQPTAVVEKFHLRMMGGPTSPREPRSFVRHCGPIQRRPGGSRPPQAGRQTRWRGASASGDEDGSRSRLSTGRSHGRTRALEHRRSWTRREQVVEMHYFAGNEVSEIAEAWALAMHC
jgi:hypothetical protein